MDVFIVSLNETKNTSIRFIHLEIFQMNKNKIEICDFESAFGESFCLRSNNDIISA